MPPGRSWSVWERLGTLWEFLGDLGAAWGALGAAEEHLGAPGAFGDAWERLGTSQASGSAWGRLGSAWGCLGGLGHFWNVWERPRASGSAWDRLRNAWGRSGALGRSGLERLGAPGSVGRILWVLPSIGGAGCVSMYVPLGSLGLPEAPWALLGESWKHHKMDSWGFLEASWKRWKLLGHPVASWCSLKIPGAFLRLPEASSTGALRNRLESA